LKSGPVTAQMMMMATAAMKVSGWPEAVAIHVAILLNSWRIRP
jgi:hypothetical protein